MSEPIFPFSAVVGQDAFKRALLLAMIDPTIGGVLAVGDKGTGKTTLIRSLTGLLSRGKTAVPFVNLPIGATEDRVLGAIQLGTLINEKKEVLQQGLLAKADSGLLYVDEINLLNDYLMDVLLDATTSGFYYLEREGISLRQSSRFCLIGSMNPEEGDLRPQLKDRFGLCVSIETPQDVETRTQIILNRMRFDSDPQSFYKGFEQNDQEVFDRISAARKQLNSIDMESDVVSYCSELALRNNVEGIRADVLLLKTARAFAALNGNSFVSVTEVDAIAEYVLIHRRKPDNKRTQNPSSDNGQQKSDELQGENENVVFQPIATQHGWKDDSRNTFETRKGLSDNGKLGNTTFSNDATVDLRKSVGQYLASKKFQVIPKYSESRSMMHLILLLDSSGSMRKENVVSFAKGFLEKSITENEGKRIQFSLLAMFNDDSSIVVDKTSNAGILIDAIQKIPTGGKTNVISALKLVKNCAVLDDKCANQLLFITDGKFGEATKTDIQQAVSAHQLYGKALHKTTLVDAETGLIHFGLVKKYAGLIRADYLQLPMCEEL